MAQVVGIIVLFLFLIVGLGALLALPVMWLWNYTMPYLFPQAAIAQLDFLHAWGLLILSGLLFKSSPSSSSSSKD